MLYDIHTLVVLPPDGLDPLGRQDQAGVLAMHLRAVEEWWQLQHDRNPAVPLVHLRAPELVKLEVNRAARNPFAQVWNGLNPRIIAGQHILALLVGWETADVAGWGGGQLAVVGEWCYRQLKDRDGDANDYGRGLLAHEIGHMIIGLHHAPAGQRPPDIMQLGTVRLTAAAARPQLARMLQAGELVGCPVG